MACVRINESVVLFLSFSNLGMFHCMAGEHNKVQLFPC